MASVFNESDSYTQTNHPPYSRLFIVLGKGNHPTKEQLNEAFSTYGAIHSIKIVKDQITSESKGICYVQYFKASCAAKALDEMNGAVLGSKPLKVMLASDKHSTEDPEIMNDKNRSRLFLFISKGTTESDLRSDFDQFGHLQYVKIITNDSGQSKGCGFIKFATPYNAALALEGCPSDYKIEYAAPKRRSFADEPSSFNSSISSQTSTYRDAYANPNPVVPVQHRKVLIRFYSPNVQSHLNKLFSIPPHFEYSEVISAPAPGVEGLAAAVYSTAEAADYARVKLNGFEYPPGCPLMASFYNLNTVNYPSESTAYYPQFSTPPPPPQPYIEAPGTTDSNPNPNPACRVFFQCNPYPPSEKQLRETFQCYGVVSDAYIVRGKKFGFVTFDNPTSAQQAVHKLNDRFVNDVQYNVTIARPRAESRTDCDSGEKRKRFD